MTGRPKVDWAQEFAHEFVRQTTMGLTQNQAHRAATQEIDRRRHLAGQSIAFLTPGAPIYDVDGDPIGMEPNRTDRAGFDETGRAIPFFTDPQEQQ